MGALAHPAMAVKRLERRPGDAVAYLAAQAAAGEDIVHLILSPEDRIALRWREDQVSGKSRGSVASAGPPSSRDEARSC